MVLSVEEMAAELGISRATAYELSHSKDFPTVRVGTRILIPIASLKDWLQMHQNRENTSDC